MLVKDRTRRALGLRLADPQSARGGSPCAFPLIQPADPARTGIVRPEPTEFAVHLMRQCRCSVKM